MTLNQFIGNMATVAEITDSTSPQMAFIKGLMIGIDFASHKVDPDIEIVARFFVESVKRHFPDIMQPMHNQLRKAVYEERQNTITHIIEYMEKVVPVLSDQDKLSLASDLLISLSFFEAELHKIHAVYRGTF